MKQFDAIIIGTGQAGPPLARRLSKDGQRVAVIERHLLGGTCVNTGCIPTKALVASAYAARLARRGADFGVMTAGPITIDMSRVQARAERIARDARDGLDRSLHDLDGCTLLRGHAAFEGSDRVRVGGEVLTAPRIFINVGARASVPESIKGVDTVPFLTNTEMVALDRVPAHLVVIGGSYIGLEFAQMYRRFGARVTVVEMADRLIGREDEEISAAVREILEKEDIDIRTNATCISLARAGQGVRVGVECGDGAPAVEGSDVLLAVGRRPNTDDLGLDRAGVVTDAKGYITVDEGLATTVPGIWALGDCNGHGGFTHTSYNDFEIVAANLLDGESRRVSDRVLGYALYIDPPLGRVGMSETAARESGRKVLVASRAMSKIGRAIEKGETEGLMKVVVDAGSRQILGAAILGTGGDEAIHGILDMINVHATADQLQWAVPIHPTVSELIPTVIGSLKPVP